MSVSQAVHAGRLRDSIVWTENNQPKIRDALLADREWAEWTDPLRRPPGMPLPAPAAGGAPPSSPPSPPAAVTPVPPARGESVASATERLRSAQANLAEIKLAEQRGELVLASDVERRLAAEISSCRTRLLAIPGRARQIIPELSNAGVLAIEDLIREVLTELSGPEL